jgi:hypothetical protein
VLHPVAAVIQHRIERAELAHHAGQKTRVRLMADPDVNLPLLEAAARRV